MSSGGRGGHDSSDRYACTFSSREELIQYVQELGRHDGFAVITRKSSVKDAWVRLGCDRGGGPRTADRDAGGLHKKPSHSIGCPYEVRGKSPAGSDQWVLEVRNLTHNHPLSKSELSTHAMLRRLSAEEMGMVKSLTRAGYKPQQILDRVQQQFPDNVSTIKTIYDARKLIRRQELGKARPRERKPALPSADNASSAWLDRGAWTDPSLARFQWLSQIVQAHWHELAPEQQTHVTSTLRNVAEALGTSGYDTAIDASQQSLPLSLMPLLPGAGVLTERTDPSQNASQAMIDPRIEHSP